MADRKRFIPFRELRVRELRAKVHSQLDRLRRRKVSDAAPAPQPEAVIAPVVQPAPAREPHIFPKTTFNDLIIEKFPTKEDFNDPFKKRNPYPIIEEAGFGKIPPLKAPAVKFPTAEQLRQSLADIQASLGDKSGDQLLQGYREMLRRIKQEGKEPLTSSKEGSDLTGDRVRSKKINVTPAEEPTLTPPGKELDPTRTDIGNIIIIKTPAVEETTEVPGTHILTNPTNNEETPTVDFNNSDPKNK